MRDRIAILGAGRLGEALVRGFLESGWRTPADLTLTARREERRNELAERYGTPVEADNAAAAAGASLVIVAVKPQDAAALLAEIGAGARPGAHAALRRRRALDRLVREPPARRGAGDPGDAEHARDRPRGNRRDLRRRARRRGAPALAEDALRHLGPVVRVAEPYMDVVTAVSGSGPAYFSLLVESMIEAGVLLGLSREISSELVIQTCSAPPSCCATSTCTRSRCARRSPRPAGTTTRALRELEQAGVRAAFLNAIRAAHERSRELAGGDLP